uniref:Uncharacterized protein n=1 Tax=Glossina palpalis gambiensis TaxID=67801 RepID=A0A1B0AQ61_9MUSC
MATVVVVGLQTPYMVGQIFNRLLHNHIQLHYFNKIQYNTAKAYTCAKTSTWHDGPYKNT